MNRAQIILKPQMTQVDANGTHPEPHPLNNGEQREPKSLVGAASALRPLPSVPTGFSPTEMKKTQARLQQDAENKADGTPGSVPFAPFCG